MQYPKRLRGTGEAGSHARAPKQEAELAKRFGGAVVRGSGSGNEKGDVRLRRVCRIEAKTTKNKSFSVTREMVAKIEAAALSSNELPAIIVEFNDKGKKVGEVAVVPTWVIDLITQHVENGL